MLKISIITICKNSECSIEKTIQSVISQDYPNIEYIIIDGMSNDNTMKIVNQFKDRISLIISEPDNGLYDALNKGIKFSKGDVIGFINSDDYFANNQVISKIVKTFQERNTDSVYSDIQYFSSTQPSKIIRNWRSKPFSNKMFFDGEFPPHPSLYIKKEIYLKYGYFNEEFKLAGDFELMLRFLVKHKVSTHYIPEVSVKMSNGGVSNRNIKNMIKSLKESFKSFEINNIRISKFYYFKTLLFRFKQLFF
jgi:glycosyltransferase involved in cell wall biosynthesis